MILFNVPKIGWSSDIIYNGLTTWKG